MTPTAKRRVWLGACALLSSAGIPFGVEHINGAWCPWFVILSLITTVVLVIAMIPSEIREQIR